MRGVSEAAPRDARELAARAEGAREAALVEVALAHEDARRVREELKRARMQFEEQVRDERGRAEARLADTRATAEKRVSALDESRW